MLLIRMIDLLSNRGQECFASPYKKISRVIVANGSTKMEVLDVTVPGVFIGQNGQIPDKSFDGGRYKNRWYSIRGRKEDSSGGK